MEKSTHLKVIRTLLFLVLFLTFNKGFSQTQAYECKIQNITLVSPTIMEFDIYIKNTGTSTLLLNSMQAGIDFNYVGMAGAGTITGAFVTGSNTLNAPQNAPNWNINSISKQIRMLASIQTTAALAAPITSTPLKLGTFRMTNTVAFTPCATPNFSWSFVAASNKTKTAVLAYVNGATGASAITDPAHAAATFANGGGPQHYVESNPAISCCPSSATYTTVNPVCFGGTGTATINITGAGAGTTGTYTVDGGAAQTLSGNPFTVSGITTGSHVLVITITGCTPFTLNITMGGPSSPLTNTTTITACNTYTWNVNGQTYTNSGSYTGSSVNGNGCSVTELLNLTISGPPTVSASVTTPISCFGNSNGAITAVGTGGGGGYTYSLNGGAYQASGVFSGLGSGTYTISVTDLNGCIGTGTITLSDPSPVLATATVTTNFSYYGASDGVITAGGSGGTLPYTFSINGGAYQSSSTFGGLGMGNFTITTKDANGCTGTSVANMSTPAGNYECFIQNINTVSSTVIEFDVFIKNTGTLPLLFNAFQGGIDFNYVGLAGSGTITGAFVAGSNSLPAPQNNPNWNINATSKQIRMLPAIMTSSASAVAITGTPLKLGTFRMTNTVPFTACATPNFSWSFITAANKTKTAVVAWVNGGTSAVAITSPTHAAATFANGGGPQHFVDANPTSSTPPSGATYTTVDPLCYGGTGTATVTLTPGGVFNSGSYTVDGGPVQSFTSNPFSISGLTTGSHTILVTQGICPPLAFNLVMGGPTAPLTNTTNISLCGTYIWSVTGLTYSTTGTYNGTSTNSNGCPVAETLNLTIVPAPIATATVTPISCNGATDGGIVTTVSGGGSSYSYSLLGGQTTSPNGIFTGLGAGTYTVLVTDAGGCTATTVVTINNPAPVTATANVTSSYGPWQVSYVGATDGIITASASGGTGTIMYSLNGGALQSSAVFNGLGAGSYTVTAVDANGCSSVAMVTISNPTVNYECNIQNINQVSPTVLEFDVFVKNTGSSTLLLSAFQGGVDFNYTGMANSGTITGAFVAGSNSLPAPQNAPNWNINATSKQIRMLAAVQGSSASAVQITSTPLKLGTFRMTNTVPFTTCATPNFTWSFITAANKTKTAITAWVDGTTNLMAITATTHTAASFANGGGPHHFVQTNHPVNCCPIVTQGTISPALCFGSYGSATIHMSSAVGGQYSVDGGALSGFSGNALNLTLSQGSHTIDVIPAGCFTTSTFTVFIGGPTSPFTTTQNTTVCDTYTWPVDGMTYTTSGTYTATTTDAQGCLVLNTLNLNVNYSTSNTTTAVACDNYTWSVSGQTYYSSGIQTITSLNAAGCTHSEILDLTIHLTPGVGGTVTSNYNGAQISCIPGNDGEVTAAASGGSGVYQFSINGGTPQSSPVFGGLSAGVYTITVHDANGCSSTNTVEVFANNNCNSTVNLKCFIEGYYIGSGMMQPALNNQGMSNPITDCDTVTVELHDATFPYNSVYSFTGVLQTDGTISCTFPPGSVGNSYYLVVNHRSAVQTWSANPISIALTNSYDFTTAITKAFGDNQVEVSTGVWAFFSGDINQDFAIDAFDNILMDPDIQNGNSGYLATDLNGDGSVDVFDFIVSFMNVYNGITIQSP